VKTGRVNVDILAIGCGPFERTSAKSVHLLCVSDLFPVPNGSVETNLNLVRPHIFIERVEIVVEDEAVLGTRVSCTAEWTRCCIDLQDRVWQCV
jgi:hypothetical protein